jgi:pimeloyl-ACP methyl ester carboxylesterase
MIEATLVTVHGFWSSPATWDRLTTVWSGDERLQGLRIHPFGYRSPKMPRMPFSTSRIPDYSDIAQTFATEYTVKLADARAVAIVTHSQGGLVLQRFLTWMVQQGHGRELSRIVSVVMLACPNNGADYLRSLRHALGYRRHPQAGSLEMLNKQVADTQRMVLQRIVNATRVDDHQCQIPFHVYAGDSDRIVVAASAQAAFPGASTLAGNHFSILDPKAPGNCTADTVRHHLLEDLGAWRTATAGPEKRGRSSPHDLADLSRRPDLRRLGHEQAGDTVTEQADVDQSGPRKIEGPVAQAGNVTLKGEYVAGHDIKFSGVERGKDKRRS